MKKLINLSDRAKGRLLRWIMNTDIAGIMLCTWTIIEAEAVNWAEYIVAMSVMTVTFTLAYWIYVIKAYERVSDDE